MYGTDAKGDNGSGIEFEGVIPNLQRRFENTESDWVKAKMHSYMSEQPCDVCHGTRLKKEAMCVRLHVVDDSQRRGTRFTGFWIKEQTAAQSNGGKHGPEVRVTMEAARREGKKTKKKVEAVPPPVVELPGNSIDDVARMTVEKAKRFFETLKLGSEGAVVAEPIIREINARLGFMVDVGLGYLTLDRKTGSLSGGNSASAWLRRLGRGWWGFATSWMNRPSACISATTPG